jgi:hypothetical protein
MRAHSKKTCHLPRLQSSKLRFSRKLIALVTSHFRRGISSTRAMWSVVRGWSLTCRFADGTEIRGDSYVTDKPLTFHTHRGPFIFKSTSSLSARTGDNPIPTNGRIPGYLFFRFPGGLLHKMASSGTVFLLVIFDINMKPYPNEIPWDTTATSEEVVRVPSVD